MEMNMESGLQKFTRRIYEEWLPEYCSDKRRNKNNDYHPSGFKADSIKVSTSDAVNFMMAVDNELVKNYGGGRCRDSRNGNVLTIFWEGSKLKNPRSITLSMEPVITIGTLACLYHDFEWPKKLICLEPKPWAFDFAVYETEISSTEFIAGEVKKTAEEIDALIDDLKDFGRVGLTVCESKDLKRINSFKKWQALQKSKPKYFWVVGPHGYSSVFEISYNDNHTATFSYAGKEVLKAPDHVIDRSSAAEKLQSLLAYCASNNRVCPNTQNSEMFLRMFDDTNQLPSDDLPYRKYSNRWNSESFIGKQENLRRFLVETSHSGQLARVDGYLRRIEEQSWIHVDDPGDRIS